MNTIQITLAFEFVAYSMRDCDKFLFSIDEFFNETIKKMWEFLNDPETLMADFFRVLIIVFFILLWHTFAEPSDVVTGKRIIIHDTVTENCNVSEASLVLTSCKSHSVFSALFFK